MKATPRLPMHLQGVDPQQFPELRYFRFESQSYEAAVLFDFFEELRLPCFQSLRNSYLDHINGAGDIRSKAVLRFLLNPRVRVECLLAAWNYGNEFVMLVTEAVRVLFPGADIGQAIHEALQRGPDGSRLQESSYFRPVMQFEGNQYAVLLYRYRALESYAVPQCGHIYVKADLFQQARLAMGAPKRESEVDGNIICCTKCRTSIGRSVFEIARRAANLYSADLPPKTLQCMVQPETCQIELFHHNNEHQHCAYCESRPAKIECHGQCKICLECAMVASCTYLYLYRCPVCGLKLRLSCLREVLGRLPAMCTWQIGTFETINCEWCSGKTSLVEINEFCYENAWYYICGACFAFHVQANTLQPPAAVDQSQTSTVIEEAKERGNQCVYCGNVRRVQEFKFYLSNQHRCQICDFCYHHFLYTQKLAACPRCPESFHGAIQTKFAQVVERAELPSIFCNKCGRQNHEREFSVGKKLSHWWQCRVCNDCLSADQRVVCQVCNGPYTGDDKSALAQVAPSLRKQPSNLAASAQIDDRQKCELCRRPSNGFTIMQCHRCHVCDGCWDALFDWTWNRTCPVCSRPVEVASISKLQELREARIRLPEMNTLATCLLCNYRKPRKEMLKKERLYHACIVCDACLINKQSPAACPVCVAPYQEPDLTIVAKLIGSVAVQTKPRDNPGPPEPVQRGCSDCHQAIGGTAPRCPKACMCSLCLLRNYAFTNRKVCPKCQKKLESSLPDHMQCSRCSRQLTISSKFMNTVSGICDNSCVLCFCCIRIENGQATCANCKAPVEVPQLQEVKRWQQKFKLGCYCGKDKGTTLTLACGHMAHNDCYPSLRACRICGYEYRQKLQGPSLSSYIS